MLKAKLDPLVREESPFAGNVNPSAPVSWVKPELVAEISFAEWTSGGMMRQAVYEGLREDKNPTDAIREIVHDTQDAVEEANRRAGNSKKAETSGTRSSTREKSRTEVGIVGKTVQLSSQDKMYWPGEGITKGDLLAYYQSISEIIMPYLVDRPQSLFRHPNGITKAGFIQKDMPHAPDWVRTVKLRAKSTEEDVEYLVCDNAAVLAYINNLGCIQLNPWNSQVTHLEKPDYMVIDLNPGENTFDEVVEVALATKEVLEAVAAYAKTSGATGIHIFVPLGTLHSFNHAKQLAQLVADRVHKQLPGLTSLERNPADRRRQVYLDYLQNSLGQTVAAAYSARPRPGATVSTPLSWDEVKHGLSPHDFTLHTLPSRLKSKGDLFKAVLEKRVDLPKCVEKLRHLQAMILVKNLLFNISWQGSAVEWIRKVWDDCF